MYSYLKDTDECGKITKDIKKNFIKKDVKHEDYNDVLFNNKQAYHKMKTIQRQKQQLGSYEINKISHSAVSMTNAVYTTMEYTVTLLVITRYHLVHFLKSKLP